MNTQLLERKLIDLTVKKSNFEPKRNYLSLSNAVNDVDKIVSDYMNGYDANEVGMLKCYKGYQMEKDLVERIAKLFPIKTGTTLRIDEYILGHPDFEIEFVGDWIPGDCKSVLMDSWMPTDKVSKKIYYQMNGYMWASETDVSIVVFESRESGLIKVFQVNRNDRVIREIREKFFKAESIILNK